MRIGPVTDAMGAERLRQSRKNFADAADYVRDHPPPEGCDAVAWAMHGGACRETAEEIDRALAKWERRQP